jgi:hypothetical protein
VSDELLARLEENTYPSGCAPGWPP